MSAHCTNVVNFSFPTQLHLPQEQFEHETREASES